MWLKMCIEKGFRIHEHIFQNFPRNVQLTSFHAWKGPNNLITGISLDIK